MTALAPPSSWTHGTLAVPDARLYYRRAGTPGKPSLLLLHGGTDNGMCWYRLASELQADFDIVLPDARGHGQSTVTRPVFSLDTMAEDVAALVEGLALTPVTIIGHSMGGQVATLLAARRPELVARVILEEPGYQMSVGSGLRSKALRVAIGLGTRWMATRSLTQLQGFARKVFRKWDDDDRAGWAGAQYEFSRGTPRPDVTQIMDPSRDWSAIFPRVQAPVLLLSAEKGFVKESEGRETAAAMQDGKHLHVVPAGHNLRRDN